MVLLFDLYLTLVALCVCAMHKVRLSFASSFCLVISVSCCADHRFLYGGMVRRIAVFLHWRSHRDVLAAEPGSASNTGFFPSVYQPYDKGGLVVY